MEGRDTDRPALAECLGLPHPEGGMQEVAASVPGGIPLLTWSGCFPDAEGRWYGDGR